MDGTRGERVRLTEVFMERVRRATGLDVIAWDERLTTVQAERVLLATAPTQGALRECRMKGEIRLHPEGGSHP